ncbi:ThuA domain-containing protein [Dyadobacter subterraneus]|uniref:ThuA domain-containing protein n=1 Tax=Dyadobacter subterraneus TaxID=2773304 RepID=A0ABR9W9J3_9BACT|nr:ThuA domain-containing protein [Dyadobacter subterraneus]MBE9462157.1 ThuA domain-containing protein [Dyadobacter subterraneus]
MIKPFIYLLACITAVTAIYLLWKAPKWPWQQKSAIHLRTDPEKFSGADIVIFSKTNGYRHKSIGAGIMSITSEAYKRGWSTYVTEDAAFFSRSNLASVKVVVFLNTTGSILKDDQKRVFENYIESGGGYAGIHSAADCEHHWIWYTSLLGTRFKSHTLIPSQITSAEIITEEKNHLATKHLPARWYKKDEWYNFKDVIRNRANIQILLSLNESSYRSIWPQNMKGDHPICWTNLIGKGRMFYSAIGHTSQTFEDKYSLEHIMGGIQWAGDL